MVVRKIEGAVIPNPHNENLSICVPSSSSHARSVSRPKPEYVLSKIACTRFVPTRQGTQMAQLSFAR